MPLRIFRKLLSLNPDDEQALLLKGEILAATDEAEQAEECFNQVLSLNPFNEKAISAVGRAFLAKKDFDKASEYMMKPSKSIQTLHKHITNEVASNY